MCAGKKIIQPITIPVIVAVEAGIIVMHLMTTKMTMITTMTSWLGIEVVVGYITSG